MSNRVVFEGLEELKAELRNLPAALTSDASQIVSDAANGAADSIRSAYPSRTGKLRNSVRVDLVSTGAFAVGIAVKNTSPLAFIFENGTQARHNSLGANRGAMPPGRVFLPRVIAARHRMYGRLKELLTRHGLTVTGSV